MIEDLGSFAIQKQRIKVKFPDDESIEMIEDFVQAKENNNVKVAKKIKVAKKKLVHEKMENFTKLKIKLDLEDDFNVDFMCHICYENSMSNKDELVEHLISKHGDNNAKMNKVQSGNLIRNERSDESNNSLRLFLSEDEHSENGY